MKKILTLASVGTLLILSVITGISISHFSSQVASIKSKESQAAVVQSLSTSPKILAILVDFADAKHTKNQTPADVMGILVTDPDSVSNFYKENTYGTFNPTDVTVTNWLPIKDKLKDIITYSGDDQIFTDAAQAAKSAGYDTANYDYVYVVTSKHSSNIIWGGITFQNHGSEISPIIDKSGTSILMNGIQSSDTYSHEFGHALGLGHFGQVSCNPPYGIPNTLATRCKGYVYMNTSVMGSGVTDLPAEQRDELSTWLGTNFFAPYVQVVTAPGTYTLSPIETAPTNSQDYKALYILWGSHPYYVEYRRPIGEFDSIGADIYKGIWITGFFKGQGFPPISPLKTPVHSDDSSLDGQTPDSVFYYYETNNTPPKETFEDESGIKIAVVAQTPNSVTINIGEPATAVLTAPPSVTLDPTQATVPLSTHVDIAYPPVGTVSYKTTIFIDGKVAMTGTEKTSSYDVTDTLTSHKSAGKTTWKLNSLAITPGSKSIYATILFKDKNGNKIDQIQTDPITINFAEPVLQSTVTISSPSPLILDPSLPTVPFTIHSVAQNPPSAATTYTATIYVDGNPMIFSGDKTTAVFDIPSSFLNERNSPTDPFWLLNNVPLALGNHTLFETLQFKDATGKDFGTIKSNSITLNIQQPLKPTVSISSNSPITFDPSANDVSISFNTTIANLPRGADTAVNTIYMDGGVVFSSNSHATANGGISTSVTNQHDSTTNPTWKLYDRNITLGDHTAYATVQLKDVSGKDLGTMQSNTITVQFIAAAPTQTPPASPTTVATLGGTLFNLGSGNVCFNAAPLTATISAPSLSGKYFISLIVNSQTLPVATANSTLPITFTVNASSLSTGISFGGTSSGQSAQFSLPIGSYTAFADIQDASGKDYHTNAMTITVNKGATGSGCTSYTTTKVVSPIPTQTPASTPSPTVVPTSSPTPVASPTSSQSVWSFSLMNADTNNSIAVIAAGSTISLATQPTQHLSIRANATPTTVGSVKIHMTNSFGSVISDRVDNTYPYSLLGDTNGAYVSWTPPVGTYTITATPYTGANATGAAGTPLTLTFTVAN